VRILKAMTDPKLRDDAGKRKSLIDVLNTYR